MKRYISLILLLIIPLAVEAQKPALSLEELMQRRKPNILFVVAQELSCTLGCYGDEIASTPNIDNFAKESILHSEMFSTISAPSPALYALFTGRHPSTDGANYCASKPFNEHLGTVAPNGVRSFSEYLRRYGYYCCSNLKDDAALTLPSASWDDNAFEAHWRNAPEDKPFFALLELKGARENYVINYRGGISNEQLASMRVPPYYPDTKAVRETLARHYNNLKKIDAQFGAILSELDSSNRANNTVVIFLSTCGGPLPRVKYELTDEATRVPFMIRYPDGKDAGSRNSDMMMCVDVAPTLLSLVGLRSPDFMLGVAQHGIHKYPDKRDFIYGAIDRVGMMSVKRGSIRNERYLYIRNYMPQQSIYRPSPYRRKFDMVKQMERMYKNDKLNEIQASWFVEPAPMEELYDRRDDPYQLYNLAGQERQERTLKRMRESYQQRWVTNFNMAWDSNGDKYFAQLMWPDDKTAECEKVRWMTMDGMIYVTNNLSHYSASYRNEGEKSWHLYTEAVEMEQGKALEIMLERIGYKPTIATIPSDN
ncbi:MAG: sulfatase-like hydrolase/transferase [Rikenellaceae bacterium]